MTDARGVILAVYREADPLIPDSVADAILAAFRAKGLVVVSLCPMCSGTGSDKTDGGPEGIPMRIDCDLCKGVGVSRYAVRAALTERTDR